MSAKDGKWARQIIALQREDGTWGPYFHSLSQPVKSKPLTTEQALRRLWALGFTAEDAPIRRTIECMEYCLRGERAIDDYWEKTHDWPLFTRMMLSTWIRIYQPDNATALCFARQWAALIERAFAGGAYNDDDFTAAYASQFHSRPRGAREMDVVHFYTVSLLQGVLTPKTESWWLDFVLAHPQGVYYVFGKPLRSPPERFASKEASHYLAALELLAGYDLAGEKLGFAADWLEANKDASGRWDFGPKAGDGVYFPVSDSWRKAEDRIADCTARVSAFLRRLGMSR